LQLSTAKLFKRKLFECHELIPLVIGYHHAYDRKVVVIQIKLEDGIAYLNKCAKREGE